MLIEGKIVKITQVRINKTLYKQIGGNISEEDDENYKTNKLVTKQLKDVVQNNMVA